MAKKIDYPAWKKAAWEAWRVFILAAFGIITAQFQAGVDLSDWRAWVPGLLMSAGIAGVKAVAKWLRTAKAPHEYGSWLYKLPA